MAHGAAIIQQIMDPTVTEHIRLAVPCASSNAPGRTLNTKPHQGEVQIYTLHLPTL